MVDRAPVVRVLGVISARLACIGILERFHHIIHLVRLNSDVICADNGNIMPVEQTASADLNVGQGALPVQFAIDKGVI